MESAVADALIGKTLDQRYVVRSRIAHGGMATVYLATDTRLDREVALKVMHAELARDTDFVNRFIGEAKSVARLSHPNIVAVFDQGSDGHYLYLAMEYVPGRTLRSLLAERGWFPYPEALRIMGPILAGLAAAHRADIVHRDVKPENVLLTADGRVKVVDFGLARAQAATRQTRAGQIIGTVAYIAPEQVQGGSTDFRTDVYAAGVMLFELLTGRQPYSGESPLAVAYAHVNSDVPPPSAFVAGLPPALDHLVRAATSRDPRLRPANAEEFLRAARTITAGAVAGGAIAGGQAADTTAFNLPNGSSPALPAPASSHTMVVEPGDFGGYDTYRSPAGAFGRDRAEPFLQRWLFSKRLGAVVVGAAVVLALGFGAWWFAAGRYAPLPRVTGMTEAQAVKILRTAGFKSAEAGPPVIDDGVAKGHVVSESPSGRAARGATVTLTISAGPRMITVPPVTGKSVAEAKAVLQEAGLRVAAATKKVGSASLQVGAVAGTTPPAGTSWPENRVVYVEVSAGIPMPPLTGQNISDVQGWAGQNNVQLNVQQTPNSAAAGTIISQSVPAGTPVTPGETVTVTVSQGPPQVPIPNVAGQPFQQVQQRLQQAGFVVKGQQFGPGQTVIATNPSGQAPQGSTITVYYGL
jgi:eukaryotic-like serine/threonine-protein kinase